MRVQLPVPPESWRTQTPSHWESAFPFAVTVTVPSAGLPVTASVAPKEMTSDCSLPTATVGEDSLRERADGSEAKTVSCPSPDAEGL